MNLFSCLPGTVYVLEPTFFTIAWLRKRCAFTRGTIGAMQSVNQQKVDAIRSIQHVTFHIAGTIHTWFQNSVLDLGR